MRDQRRGLSAEEQQSTARRIAETALQQSDFPLGDHVALYMDADGEVGTGTLLEALLAEGKACYLPVLEEATTTLQFRQYLPGTPLVTNFYGLQEPAPDAPVIDPRALSLVFTPLVAFDRQGNRVGMGKGYYDRTFAFLREEGVGSPVLVGLAHEIQRVDNLEAAPWDVPLGGIITGEQVYRCS